MEVILKKDVENLGFKDDLLTVKPGYARNYLIPQGFAVAATSSEKRMLEETLKQRAFKEKKVVEDANKMAEGLRAAEVKITAKTGGGNKLFGSVTNANLAEELAKMGHSIDKKFIKIQGGTVKSTGNYEAHIRLHREVNVILNFDVVAQAK